MLHEENGGLANKNVNKTKHSRNLSRKNKQQGALSAMLQFSPFPELSEEER